MKSHPAMSAKMATTSLVGTRAQARWKAAQAVDKRAPTKTERAASAAGPGRPAKMAGKVTLYITEAAARVLASSGAGLSRAFAAREPESAGMDSPTSSDVPSPLLAEDGRPRRELALSEGSDRIPPHSRGSYAGR